MLFVLAALSFTLSLVLQTTLFRHGSGDADEAAYVMQARMLLHGQLTLDQNLVEPFFRPWLTGVHNGRVFTKYLPGWPAMLAASQLLFGTMIVAPALVAAAWAVGVYRLARELFDDVATALVSAAFLVFSPLVVVHTALPMAYAFTAAALTIAIAEVARGTRTGARWSLVAGGVALGLAATARPFDAVLVTLVCALVVAGRFVTGRLPTGRLPTGRLPTGALSAGVLPAGLLPTSRRRRPSPRALLRHTAWIGLGALPFAVVVAAFCRHVTGSMRTLPLAASDPLDRFGFGERRILPSEPPFAFTRHLAVEAWQETVAAAPGWLFGGRALIVLAVLGLLVAEHRRARLLLAANVLLVFAAYFFWWGSAMAMPSLRDGLGPHYHMVALTPVVILAGSGACWLWRRLPGRFFARPARGPVAGVCLLALAAVTALAVPGKVNVQRYVNAVDKHVLDLVPNDLGGPAVVIVTPPTPSRYTQVPYHFLRNSPDLLDEVLYAADVGAATVGLAEQMPGRRLYRLRPDERIAADEPGSLRGSFVELRTVEGETIDVRVSAVVPANRPYASVYLRLGDRRETRPLTGTAGIDATRTVTWKLDGRSGAGLLASGVSPPASEAHPPAELVVGLVAGTTSDLARALRWEERIPLRQRSDGSLVLLAPGQGFRQVPELYGDAWVQATVTGTLGVAVESASLSNRADR